MAKGGMMKKLSGVLFLCFLSLILCSCLAPTMSGIIHGPKTPEEKAWMDKVMSEPIEFEVDAQEEKVAWSRAQSWISEYSGVPVKIISDSVIETEVPQGGSTIGYKVIKTQKPGGSFMIKVSGVSSDILGAALIGMAKEAEINLHILAHYIKTGDLPYPYLIRTNVAPARPKK